MPGLRGCIYFTLFFIVVLYDIFMPLFVPCYYHVCILILICQFWKVVEHWHTISQAKCQVIPSL